MSQCLFLTGPSCVGKSTLLLQSLMPYVGVVGGFMVQRLYRDDELKGFCLREVDGRLWPVNADYSGDEQNVFLAETGGKWLFYPRLFERIAVRLLLVAGGKKILLLDEIGGAELLCQPFRERLYELLDGYLPCIGVLKSADNRKMMQSKVEVAACYNKLYEELSARLSANLVQVTADNRESVRIKLEDFLQKEISP